MAKINVTVPNHLLNLRRQIKLAVGFAVEDVREILSAYVARSIRQRWYRTGVSLRSYKTRFLLTDRGGRAEAESGTSYDVFGEYGTGRRGAASDGRPPASWRYGTVPGIAARRMYGRAVEEATPAAREAVRRRLKSFVGTGVQ